MEIPREQVARLLRSQGDDQQADRAERELPASVDTDRDSEALAGLGVDVKQLMSTLGPGGDLGMSGEPGGPSGKH